MVSGHVKAQALRFVRMTGLVLAGQLLALGHWPGWAGLWAMAVGSAEVAVREVYPTVRLPDRITSVSPTAAAAPSAAPSPPLDGVS